MTTIDLSNELINEIYKRQNGLCALTGKKFDLENDTEFQAFKLKPELPEEITDNVVLVWKEADLAPYKTGENSELKLKKYQFQFANFSEFSSKDKSSEISEEIQNIIEIAKNDDKLKFALQSSKNLLKTLNSLNLLEEDFKPLSEEISNQIHTFEEKNSKIRNQIHEDSAKFLDTYKSKIEELKNTPINWQSLRSSRQKLLNLQNEISNSKIKVSKNTVEELKKNIADALSFITQKQLSERENYEMECSDNYLQLKSHLDKVVASIENSTVYSKIRQDLIDSQKMISGKTLKRNQQEELYQIIRNGFEILSSSLEKEKSTFIEEANANYEKLVPIVDNAINIATNTDTFKEARESLIAAQASIKGLTLTKEQRDDLYGKIRSVFDKVNQQQEDERGEFLKNSEENFAKLLDKISIEKNKLFENPHFKTIRENLLNIQSEIRVWKLKTDHRNKLYDALKEAFSTLDEKRNSFFENQQQQRKSKSNSLLKNLKEKLIKLEEALIKDKEELDLLSSQIDDSSIDIDKEKVNSEIESLKSMISEKEKRIDETKARLKISD